MLVFVLVCEPLRSFCIGFCIFWLNCGDSKKVGSESGYGRDLAPMLGNFGARWDQVGAKLGPS